MIESQSESESLETARDSNDLVRSLLDMGSAISEVMICVGTEWYRTAGAEYDAYDSAATVEECQFRLEALGIGIGCVASDCLNLDGRLAGIYLSQESFFDRRCDIDIDRYDAECLRRRSTITGSVLESLIPELCGAMIADILCIFVKKEPISWPAGQEQLAW